MPQKTLIHIHLCICIHDPILCCSSQQVDSSAQHKRFGAAAAAATGHRLLKVAARDHGLSAIAGISTIKTKEAITSKRKYAIKHAIKLKTSPARLAQLLQPSLAFCFSLQPITAHRPVLDGTPSLAAS